MTTKEKALDISMLLGTAIAVICALFANFAKECDNLYESTFRLHILANSDSAEDLRTKYALRDYILTDMADIFTSCGTKDEAVELARRSLPYIEERVNDYLRSSGCPYPASCSIVNDTFPSRSYGDLTLPAGSYDALRITIGAGEGHNWWCVLYPSLCLNAASVPDSPLPRRTLYDSLKSSHRATADSHAPVRYRFAVYEFFKKFF